MLCDFDILIKNFNQNYQERNLDKGKKRSIVLSYCGMISQDLVNSIASCVEQKMIASLESKKVVKRMFSILIEGLQNLKLHGIDGLNGEGCFVLITKDENNYYIEFGNLIPNQSLEKLTNILEKINHYSQEELKEVYVQQLSNGIFSEKGGAGLGFLTMRLKSHGIIKYKFHSLSDDYSMFTYSFIINKLEN
jgi:hypothetical protein